MAKLISITPAGNGAIKEATLFCSEKELRAYVSYVTKRPDDPEMSIWEWLFRVWDDIVQENESELQEYHNFFYHIRSEPDGHFSYITKSGHQIHAVVRLPEETDEKKWKVVLLSNPLKFSKVFLYYSLAFFHLMNEEVRKLIGPIVHD